MHTAHAMDKEMAHNASLTKLLVKMCVFARKGHVVLTVVSVVLLIISMNGNKEIILFWLTHWQLVNVSLRP